MKIFTDQGIYGLGDATLNAGELAMASYLQGHLIPCLIGRDPAGGTSIAAHTGGAAR